MPQPPELDDPHKTHIPWMWIKPYFLLVKRPSTSGTRNVSSVIKKDAILPNIKDILESEEDWDNSRDEPQTKKDPGGKDLL